jgi:hypothetical protein
MVLSLCSACPGNHVSYPTGIPQVIPLLIWGFKIRMDSVEGRIRADSGGFRAAPQGGYLAYFAVCLYGHLDPITTGSDSGGFLDPGLGICQHSPPGYLKDAPVSSSASCKEF